MLLPGTARRRNLLMYELFCSGADARAAMLRGRRDLSRAARAVVYGKVDINARAGRRSRPARRYNMPAMQPTIQLLYNACIPWGPHCAREDSRSLRVSVQRGGWFD